VPGGAEGGDARSRGWTDPRVMLEVAFGPNPAPGPAPRDETRAAGRGCVPRFTPRHPNPFCLPEPGTRERQDLGDGETEAPRGKGTGPCLEEPFMEERPIALLGSSRGRTGSAGSG